MGRILAFLAWFLGSLFFGLVFIAIFMNSTELDCARQPNSTYTCHFRTMFFGKYPISESQTENIRDIKMESSYDSDSGTTYRAEFVTTSGEQVPLSVVWTDHDPVAKQVDTIGSQIDSGVENITYRVDPQWLVLFLIGGLTIMSMGLSFLTFLRPRAPLARYTVVS
jgi:hypothetical protein